jgi:3-carboxy-cis,cis-muconate cycloisomerase
MAVDLKLSDDHGDTTADAWQTQRDEWVALACEAGVLCGSLGKIAKDISLLAQAEVGEMAEPSGGGRGGSSAMPHKRNPVASMVAIAASIRAPHRVAAMLAAMPQEHERGLGNWQAELAEWPGLFMSLHGASSALTEAAAGLSIDAPRMRRNIDALHGLVFAEAASMLFAKQVGKAKAHALLETLSRRTVDEGRSLLDVAIEACAADPALAASIDVAHLRSAFDIDATARQASASVESQWAEIRSRLNKHDKDE